MATEVPTCKRFWYIFGTYYLYLAGKIVCVKYRPRSLLPQNMRNTHQNVSSTRIAVKRPKIQISVLLRMETNNRYSELHTSFIRKHNGLMVYLQTENPNLGNFWRVLERKMLKFCDHLVYFAAIWSILWTFGIYFPVLVSYIKKNLATLL
jgi:hypothetical protein